VTASVTAPPVRPLPFVRQARLTTAALTLDKRVNAYRPDLAHIDLSDRIGAQHFAIPAPVTCVVPVTGVLLSPDAASENISQLLLGETFICLEKRGDWLWGQCAHDAYVGYVRAAAFAGGTLAAATHRVGAAQAHVFSAPSIKSEILNPVYRGSPLAITATDGKFSELGSGGFIRSSTLVPANAVAADWVAQARDFIAAPYVWGGRTRAGVDCSGLVQSALMACGIACPRDSDMQAREIGIAVPEADWQNLQRGDFVFFPGHVGIMHDRQNLLHANAFHMQTLIEPLADVIARLVPDHAQPVTAVRRLAKDGCGTIQLSLS
jgi:cell wall-associated NlpC family hydrolase